HKHVMGGSSLREQWYLALYLHEAAVGAARTAGVFKNALLDDLGTEPPGRASQRIGEKFVRLVGADHEQPLLPTFEHQILGEAVSQHGSRRCRMDHIGAAIFFAQSVVDCPHIEEH